MSTTPLPPPWSQINARIDRLLALLAGQNKTFNQNLATMQASLNSVAISVLNNIQANITTIQTTVADIQTTLATKEDASNKVTDVTGQTTSTSKYPSISAMVNYVGAEIAPYVTSSQLTTILTNYATQTYVGTVIAGMLKYVGIYDASSDTYPSSGGSGVGGAIQSGNVWLVSVVGTLGGTAVKVGDLVIAKVDNPGQTIGNWDVQATESGYVSENAANKNASGGYLGLSGYSAVIKDVTGLVTSLLSSAATLARTWVLPDKSGTIALTSDITGTNSGVNTGDETQARIGALISGATSISTIDTDDKLALYDSATNTLVAITGSAFTTWLNSAGVLSSYVTTTGLTSTLTGYVPTSTLANYYTQTDINSMLSGYVTATGLATTLSGYVQTSTLSNYVTTSSLSTSLSAYVTNSSLTTTLNGYATTTSVNTLLTNYAGINGPFNGPVGNTAPNTGAFTTLTASGTVSFTGTGSVKVNSGTTAQRAGTGAANFRFNSDLNQYEGTYNDGSWAAVGGSFSITDDTTTNSLFYPMFTSLSSGAATGAKVSHTELTYNPSTGDLEAPIIGASNGIVLNSNTIAKNTTIPTGFNGHSVGPITINAGVTVTVSPGSIWRVTT